MAKAFLHYWVPDTAARELTRQRNPFSIGSEQLSPRKVKLGDTIWVVTVEDGVFLLLGRVIVGEVIEGRAEAIARLGTDDIWDATYTVLAEPGTIEPLQPVNISPIAEHLVFKSRSAAKLTVVGGKVNPQQLQSTRELTPQSADLIEECWETAEPRSNTGAQLAP
ncbi:MAG: hypothetical protein RLZZ387_3410 [Chloroflexota bacterium]